MAKSGIVLGAPVGSTLHMVRSQKTVHIAVVVLFAIAIAFYLAGLASAAIALSVVGFILEIVAWVTWFVIDSNAKDSQKSDAT